MKSKKLLGKSIKSKARRELGDTMSENLSRKCLTNKKTIDSMFAASSEEILECQ